HVRGKQVRSDSLGVLTADGRARVAHRTAVGQHSLAGARPIGGARRGVRAGGGRDGLQIRSGRRGDVRSGRGRRAGGGDRGGVGPHVGRTHGGGVRSRVERRRLLPRGGGVFLGDLLHLVHHVVDVAPARRVDVAGRRARAPLPR